jgi:hypothetical protein
MKPKILAQKPLFWSAASRRRFALLIGHKPNLHRGCKRFDRSFNKKTKAAP